MNEAPSSVISDTPDLRISYEPGVTGTAVISFTGIGMELGGIQKEEFAGSLREQSSTHSVFYVTDRRRSWFNRTRDEILAHLTPRLQDYDQVVTLGNSMGGFGALYFSGLLPRCTRAISFVPQYSVTLDTPERRWMDWRSQITDWKVRHALENLSERCPSVVIFGSGRGSDGWHIEQFRRQLREPHAMFVLAAAGHTIAKAVRTHGALSSLIASAIAGAPAASLRDLLTKSGLQCK